MTSHLPRAALLLAGLTVLQATAAQALAAPDAPSTAASAPARGPARGDGTPAPPPPGASAPMEERGGTHARRTREPTVVTATRAPVEVEQQPRALSVVSREELQRRPARTTPETLLEAEGVFLPRTYPGGDLPIVRGLSGQDVLLLVDGVRLNNATVGRGPSALLTTVDPFLVEQVEVLRGPGSVLYGSDAVGGVVNVRTAWPRFSGEGPVPSASLRALGGSAARSLQGHLRTELSLADTAVWAGLTAQDFNELRGGPRVGVQPYTAYEEGDAALKLRHRFGPGTQLFFQYQAVRQRDVPRLDRSTPGDFLRLSRVERDFLHARLESSGPRAVRRASVELSAQRQEDVADRFRLGPGLLERDAVNAWTFGLRAEAEGAPLASLPGRPTPLLGAELFHDRVGAAAARALLSGGAGFTPSPADARYPDHPAQLSAALFGMLSSDPDADRGYHAGARLQWQRASLPRDTRLAERGAGGASPLPVLPGERADTLAVAGEVGLRQRVLPSLSLLLNLGSAFHAPNLDDFLRMGPDGAGFLVPGRELHPEQSYSAELGARLTGEVLHAQAFYAYTLLPGRLGTVPLQLDGQTRTPEGLPYLVRQNGELAQVHVLEGAASARLAPGLTLATHATWTLGRQRRPDFTRPGTPNLTEPLSRTPPLHGLVRATWEPQLPFLGRFGTFTEASFRWALAQEALSAEDRLDLRICPEGPVCTGTPGWTSVALRGGARFGRHVSATLALQNLLDVTYRTHGSGVAEPGRSILLSLEASL